MGELRQVVRELGELHGPGDARRVGVAAPGNVPFEGGREQEGLLRHERDRPVELRERDLADVVAVDRDAAGADVVDADDEVDECRLAGARRADDGQRGAGRYIDCDVVEHRAVEVAETYVLKTDATADLRQGVHARRISDGGLASEHFFDALHGSGGLLVQVEGPAEVHHRHREKDDVEIELHEVAQRDGAGLHVERADVEDDDRAEADEDDQ